MGCACAVAWVEKNFVNLNTARLRPIMWAAGGARRRTMRRERGADRSVVTRSARLRPAAEPPRRREAPERRAREPIEELSREALDSDRRRSRRGAARRRSGELASRSEESNLWVVV